MPRTKSRRSSLTVEADGIDGHDDEAGDRQIPIRVSGNKSGLSVSLIRYENLSNQVMFNITPGDSFNLVGTSPNDGVGYEIHNLNGLRTLGEAILLLAAETEKRELFAPNGSRKPDQTRPSHQQANRWADDAGDSCDCGHAKASHNDDGRCRAQRGRCKCRCFAIPGWGTDAFVDGSFPGRADLMYPLGFTLKLYDDRFAAFLADKSFEQLSLLADDAAPGSFRAAMIRRARKDRHVVTELDRLAPGIDVLTREVVEANDWCVTADGRNAARVGVELIQYRDSSTVIRLDRASKDLIAIEDRDIVIRRADAFRAFLSSLLAIAKDPTARRILMSLEPNGVA